MKIEIRMKNGALEVERFNDPGNLWVSWDFKKINRSIREESLDNSGIKHWLRTNLGCVNAKGNLLSRLCP